MNEAVGPYQVLREIGRGRMGVVYLARDTRLERDVAIKALPEELVQDPVRLERFEREARAIAGLNHRNIAGINGVEEQDSAKYLILEYVDGVTLADRLDAGALPVDEVIEIAGQIAAGTEAALEAGVIHRDLKPANIMITPEGVAKVLDFGFARTDDGQSSTGARFDDATMPQNSPTIAGIILGTVAYMSLEQARGGRVDKRTDIWAFGVLLSEMLTGANPFRGDRHLASVGLNPGVGGAGGRRLCRFWDLGPRDPRLWGSDGPWESANAVYGFWKAALAFLNRAISGFEAALARPQFGVEGLNLALAKRQFDRRLCSFEGPSWWLRAATTPPGSGEH